MDFNKSVEKKMLRLIELHKAKAAEYGDTISRPFEVFSKASPKERIKMMIDTKLSRIAMGKEPKEDSYKDLIAYLFHAWELEFPETSELPEYHSAPLDASKWYQGNSAE